MLGMNQVAPLPQDEAIAALETLAASKAIKTGEVIGLVRGLLNSRGQRQIACGAALLANPFANVLTVDL